MGVANTFSLYNELNYYKFIKDSQKKALEDLMQYAGIISDNQTFKEMYPLRNNDDKLLEDILDFVQHTQKHFILRKNTQERWEVHAAKWINENKTKIIENARELGFTQAVVPSNSEADAVCILGSTYRNMQNRINYAAKYLDNGKLKTKNIILLAGEREVSIGTDGEKQNLLKIANKYDICDLKSLTETHLLQAAYETSPIYNKFQTYVIDTPANKLPRPSTETTIMELLKWLKKHQEIKKIIFVSNQPYIKYQEAIISQVVKSRAELEFEVIGSDVNEDIETYEIVENIGSFIWAKTPSVISKYVKFKISEKLSEEFAKLYSDNFLIYSDIKSLFEKGN